MLEPSKKLLARVDAINKQRNRHFELNLRLVSYTPEHPAFKTLSEGDLFAFKKSIMHWRRMKRRTGKNVYGCTFGNRYIAVHWRSTIMHISFAGIHSNYLLARYYLKDAETGKYIGRNKYQALCQKPDIRTTYTRREMQEVLYELEQ